MKNLRKHFNDDFRKKMSQLIDGKTSIKCDTLVRNSMSGLVWNNLESILRSFCPIDPFSIDYHGISSNAIVKDIRIYSYENAYEKCL